MGLLVLEYADHIYLPNALAPSLLVPSARGQNNVAFCSICSATGISFIGAKAREANFLQQQLRYVFQIIHIMTVDRDAHCNRVSSIFEQFQSAQSASETLWAAEIMHLGAGTVHRDLDRIQALAAFTNFKLFQSFLSNHCAIAEKAVAHTISDDTVNQLEQVRAGKDLATG